MADDGGRLVSGTGSQLWRLQNDFGALNNGNIEGQTLTYPEGGASRTISTAYQYDSINLKVGLAVKVA